MTRFVGIRGPVNIYWSACGTNFIGGAKELRIKSTVTEDGYELPGRKWLCLGFQHSTCATFWRFVGANDWSCTQYPWRNIANAEKHLGYNPWSSCYPYGGLKRYHQLKTDHSNLHWPWWSVSVVSIYTIDPEKKPPSDVVPQYSVKNIYKSQWQRVEVLAASSGENGKTIPDWTPK